MIKKLNELNDLIEKLKVMIATDENIRMIADDIADRFLNDLEKTSADALALKLERPYKILKFKLSETITNVPTQFIRPDGFGTG